MPELGNGRWGPIEAPQMTPTEYGLGLLQPIYPFLHRLFLSLSFYSGTWMSVPHTPPTDGVRTAVACVVGHAGSLEVVPAICAPAPVEFRWDSFPAVELPVPLGYNPSVWWVLDGDINW